MELQLINFTQAKALRELGLSVERNDFYAYDENGELIGFAGLLSRWKGEIENLPKELYAAPTLELCAKWLREEKDINVVIGIYNTCYYYELYESFDYINLNHRTDNYPIYEEALSAGIDKAIEILKKSK